MSSCEKTREKSDRRGEVGGEVEHLNLDESQVDTWCTSDLSNNTNKREATLDAVMILCRNQH